ncbi:MAG: hypothetical protein JST10_05030 [Bacteroidetes bacterium]|nr:hypothetical protein [Bacteroidota bacterium]MBS1631918.1 hypothetical protein [Bacteroidota bacterium]
MSKLKVITLSFIIFLCSSVSRASNTALIIPPGNKTYSTEILIEKISSLKLKQLKKLSGRKLTLKEKIGFLVLKHQLRHGAVKEKTPGSTAFTIALIGLGLLIAGIFVPYVLIGSLVAAILAIAMGSSAYNRDNSDKKGRTAKLIGWLTLGAIAFLSILAAIVLSSLFSLF